MKYFFGGSFDPLTRAHEFIIRSLLADMKTEDRLIIGVSDNDSKPQYRCPGLERLAILRQFVLECLPPLFRTSVEVVLQPMRTWDFLEWLGRDIDTIVVGEDEYVALQKGLWHHADQLKAKYSFRVFPRTGSPISSTAAMEQAGRASARPYDEQPFIQLYMTRWAAEAYRLSVSTTTDDERRADEIIEWIANWFSENGGKRAVLGVSGGKDSNICAELCARALGRDNVVCVSMPDLLNDSSDKTDKDYVDLLMKYGNYPDFRLVDIGPAKNAILEQVPGFSVRTVVNLPPRLRMATLYAIAQSVEGGRVCCTDNMSEWFLGYSTLWGDSVGDFAPLLTSSVAQVRKLGDALGMPYGLVHRTPADGLSGKSDEDNMRIRYDDLQTLFDNSAPLDAAVFDRLRELHDASQFKRNMLHLPCPFPDRLEKWRGLL